MTDVAASIAEFGADPAALLLFDHDRPELLPYATLLTARRGGDSALDAVVGIYEWQGSPLIFLVDAATLADEAQLHRIRRLLAMRGDAPYLGIVAPGQFQVYRIALDSKSPGQARVEWAPGDDAAMTAFARLGNLRPHAAIRQRDWISNVVLNLLTGSIGRLIALEGISDEDAISLVGRALFTRFLADRQLLPAGMSDDGVAASLFDKREAAAMTSAWLDTTFNGDLLPLSTDIFARLPDSAYHVLGDVLRRAPDGQLFLGWEEKWDNLDFAHIPVGVLSQAYELYLRNHAPARQRREGGYYTPRPIADLLVRASFRALERQADAHRARVLDPAAGAGVFLLTAFRELVAQQWRFDHRRPDTAVLRSILYNQITGFDINEAALRFAALGLYLMSIELDPNPRPVDKLRFRNMRGKVLHRLAVEEQAEGAQLGSLGPLVGEAHAGRYDLVVGNPPWASGTGLADWHLIRATVARIAVDRGVPAAPPLPNEGLDLPFVWRAMEWAKPGGQIAFALHARLLFQQGDGMAEARQALFEALDINSIINGVELRQTKVWPEISAPFCLLLATNRPPEASAGFRLVSPRIEASLNDSGAMRIDALNAEIIQSGQLRDTPELLKILFRGGRADLGIVERIRAQGHPTLENFWREAIGVTERGHLKGSGNGYQKLRLSSPVRPQEDGKPGDDARSLLGLGEITAASFTAIAIDSAELTPFTRGRVHRLRSRDLFIGPFVVVHKSPPALTGRIGVAISYTDAVYNETFYGYSPGNFSDGLGLARYLTLVLGSRLAVWFALVTSGEFGFEREVIEKATLDRIPLPDFREFGQACRDEMDGLYAALEAREVGWDAADEWVARLYGLGPRDLQAIADTLAFNLPFAQSKRDAQASPDAQDRARFCAVLEMELRPWSERFGTAIAVRPMLQPALSPWQGVEVHSGSEAGDGLSAEDWKGLMRAADDAAASEILLRETPSLLLVGRLAQRRYWSDTQARLLAQRIIWSHVDLLQAPGRA